MTRILSGQSVKTFETGMVQKVLKSIQGQLMHEAK